MVPEESVLRWGAARAATVAWEAEDDATFADPVANVELDEVGFSWGVPETPAVLASPVDGDPPFTVLGSCGDLHPRNDNTTTSNEIGQFRIRLHDTKVRGRVPEFHGDRGTASRL